MVLSSRFEDPNDAPKVKSTRITPGDRSIAQSPAVLSCSSGQRWDQCRWARRAKRGPLRRITGDVISCHRRLGCSNICIGWCTGTGNAETHAPPPHYTHTQKTGGLDLFNFSPETQQATFEEASPRLSCGSWKGQHLERRTGGGREVWIVRWTQTSRVLATGFWPWMYPSLAPSSSPPLHTHTHTRWHCGSFSGRAVWYWSLLREIKQKKTQTAMVSDASTLPASLCACWLEYVTFFLLFIIITIIITDFTGQHWVSLSPLDIKQEVFRKPTVVYLPNLLGYMWG